MRNACLVAMLAGFIGLGLLDLNAGQWRTALASLLLAAANALLLIRFA